MKLSTLIAAAAATALPVVANAALLVVGTSATVFPTANQVVDVTAGSVVTLFVWADTTNNSNYLASGGFGIQSENAGTLPVAQVSPSANFTAAGGTGSNLAINFAGSGVGFNTRPTNIGAGTAAVAATNYRPSAGLTGLVNARGWAFAADQGVNPANAARPIASFQVSVGAGGVAGQSRNLFIVLNNVGLTESPALATDTHFLGYNAAGDGLDGSLVDTAGATVVASGGFSNVQSPFGRSSVADVTLRIPAVVVSNSLTIAADASNGGNVLVGDGSGVRYSAFIQPLAGATSGSVNFGFSNPQNPNAILVAVDLVGTTLPTPLTNSGYTNITGSAAANSFLASLGLLGSTGYDLVLSYSGVIGGPGYKFAWTGFGINKIAVIPEPASLGLLGVAGLALARRRRA
jgi:hypothetical protein